MILTMNNSLFELLISDLAKRFRKQQNEDTLYSNCTQCERELEDETSQIIGRGPICRKGERMRFTVLPGVWPTTKKVIAESEWNDDEWEEIEVGLDHPDLLRTMDEQADELDLDFIIVAYWTGNSDSHTLYVRQKSPPFDWINLNGTPAAEHYNLDMRSILLLDTHEYVPHTLIHSEEYAEDKWPNTADMWNSLVMLTNSGLWLRRRDACAPSYDDWEEVDNPICDECKEWYRETYDGGTRPGQLFLEERFSKCPQCHFMLYDDDDEMVYLGDLTVWNMLRGDGEISNPYHPGRTSDGGNVLRYSIFQEQIAWELSYGNSHWDDDPFGHLGPWRDQEPREYFPHSQSEHETRIWTRICEGVSDDCIFWGGYGVKPIAREAMGEPLCWRDKIYHNLRDRDLDIDALYQFDMIFWMIPPGGIPFFDLGENPIVDISGNIVHRADCWDYIIHGGPLDWAIEGETFRDMIDQGNETILDGCRMSKIQTATPPTMD